MAYVRKLVRSGDVLEIEEYYEPVPLSCENAPVCVVGDTFSNSEDREKKAEYEYRAKVKRVSRLINANFAEGDLSLALTFRKSVSIAKSQNDLVNYLRAVKRRRKRLGLPPLKYIAVTEFGSSGKNKHHHLIINDMPADDAMGLWKHGKVTLTRLVPFADYTGLARYITKEPKRKYEKQIKRSRNLVEPQEMTMPAIPSMADIKLPDEYKGFHVVQVRNLAGKHISCRKYLKAIAPSGHDWGQGDELLK